MPSECPHPAVRRVGRGEAGAVRVDLDCVECDETVSEDVTVDRGRGLATDGGEDTDLADGLWLVDGGVPIPCHTADGHRDVDAVQQYAQAWDLDLGAVPDDAFRVLLDVWMLSGDLEADVDYGPFEDLLDEEAERRGFDGRLDAYHEFEPDDAEAEEVSA